MDVDFVVVGSGFGGSVSALRLVQKGYTVRVLERGIRYEPSDFPKTNWNVRKSFWLPFAKCFGTLNLSFLSDILVLSGSGVGGGSLVYANTLYVPKDSVFLASPWGKIKDWKSALIPHYATVQQMLGVTQNPFEGEPDRILKSIAEHMGRGHTYVRTPVGVYFGKPDEVPCDPYFGGQGPLRSPCKFCGGCMVGCRSGAKNTLDKNYLYFAEKLGAIIEPKRTVVEVRALAEGGYEITHDESGAWWQKDRKTIRAKKVVLAAGVLGTVELLLKCKERGTLPRLSDCLGQFVRTNSEAILGVSTSDSSVHYSQGIAITSSIHPDDDTHIEVVRYSEGSDALKPLATLLTDGPWRMPRFLFQVLCHPIQFARTLWPFGWAKRGVFLLVMQTLDNSIALRWRRRWWRLFARVLDSDRSGANPAPTYIPIGHNVARQFASRVKGGTAYSSILEIAFNVPTTAHILGGAVMGASPETGVIDEHNEVFGHPGLFVCDGSMIPVNLGVNPSLTIAALTEHAMSHL